MNCILCERPFPSRPAVDYSVKTLSQLRPVLRGFRMAAGLTQATVAARLGITQQSYAQFEANPAAAGVERLFKVLRLLNAGITLSQNEAHEPASTKPAAKMARKVTSRRTTPGPGTSTAAPAAKAKAQAKAQTKAQAKARKTAQKKISPVAPRPKARAMSAPKKREQW
jgi:HTH-type transcriptional regulator / antitoxin HipB